MKKLINYFLKGLLIFVPAALTIFTVIWLFTTLDGLFGSIFKIDIPGLGLAATIVVITLTGLLASNFIGNRFFELVDHIFKKLPLVKLLYSALKDMIEAFTGKKKGFEKPVIVELIKDGPKALGFVTRDTLESLGLADHAAVYLPQSYNFAGSVLIFPAERVKPLNIAGSDAMAFIVSGGVSGK